MLLEQEHCKWKQRAKQNWYQYGDRNTSFSHTWANHRRKVNNIKKILDEAGREWKKRQEIGLAFTQYYQALFLAREPIGINECLATLDTRVTTEMNAKLLRAFSVYEVEAALTRYIP